VGVSANLYIRSGAQPADCATADSGTLLCTIPLPSDWMAAAAAGAKSKLGTWSAAASAAGTAAHFRIKDSAGTTCHMQGSVGQGSGDMSLDNTNIASGQTVTVNTFTLTDANA
jgi:hypothetical protein